ncbi:MAG TPA: flagellar assembly protein FliW [candidate division Zixibacteria bacterium]|nr:flagellar assembly protein FliW [candidate division Zixibacteria bacterium]
MLIKSIKFGQLDIPEDKLIAMKRPILGFEHLTGFCLIEREELSPFLWLHSTENEGVAFVVVNPAVFYPDYRIEVNPNEIAELEIDDVRAVETYVIVTLADRMENITANLQGPILINTENGFAKQLVLVNSRYEVKHSLVEAIPDRKPEPVRRREPALV